MKTGRRYSLQRLLLKLPVLLLLFSCLVLQCTAQENLLKLLYSIYPAIDGNLTLMNNATQAPLRGIQNGDVVALNRLSTAANLNVQVRLKSFKFFLSTLKLDYSFNDGSVATTSSKTSPAMLKSTSAATLSRIGTHNIKITATDSNGILMDQKTVAWSVVAEAPMMLTGFTLMDADSDETVTQVEDGDVIYMKSLATPVTNMNLRADVSDSSQISSVTFTFNNGMVVQEATAPYALGGDKQGDYYPVGWLTIPGPKLVKAVAKLKTGESEERTVRFQVTNTDDVDSGPATAPVASPVPKPVAAPVAFKPTAPTVTAAGDVVVTGEFRTWHKITLAFLKGPPTSEGAATTNPFTDYRLDVVFTNNDGGGVSSSSSSSSLALTVPGYYAADGDAANTGATAGSVWHCHFSPPATGSWTWQASFVTGKNVALQSPGSVKGTPTAFDGATGSFVIQATNKFGGDLRSKGLLRYIEGKHHLQFAETGEWFLKAGSDSPENFLAYDDFDNTPNNGGYRKSWSAHKQDYRLGDPSWAGGKGTDIIGAVNYLSAQGMRAFSFLTMNINGDDKNVFPYVSPSDRLRIDVSKTAQWEIVFEHADEKGLFLHFKTQETENDQLLDGGALGNERKLYYRELIARFGHHLALNWNLGEENTNTDAQRKDFCDWIRALDPYKHPIVVHTPIEDQNSVYGALYGYPNFEGASIQSQAANVFRDTLARVKDSAAAGRPWVVANDEQGNAQTGVMPDSADPEHNDIRELVLWGNIMVSHVAVYMKNV